MLSLSAHTGHTHSHSSQPFSSAHTLFQITTHSNGPTQPDSFILASIARSLLSSPPSPCLSECSLLSSASSRCLSGRSLLSSAPSPRTAQIIRLEPSFWTVYLHDSSLIVRREPCWTRCLETGSLHVLSRKHLYRDFWSRL